MISELQMDDNTHGDRVEHVKFWRSQGGIIEIPALSPRDIAKIRETLFPAGTPQPRRRVRAG
jgi:hypothetical protein